MALRPAKANPSDHAIIEASKTYRASWATAPTNELPIAMTTSARTTRDTLENPFQPATCAKLAADKAEPTSAENGINGYTPLWMWSCQLGAPTAPGASGRNAMKQTATDISPSNITPTFAEPGGTTIASASADPTPRSPVTTKHTWTSTP